MIKGEIYVALVDRRNQQLGRGHVVLGLCEADVINRVVPLPVTGFQNAASRRRVDARARSLPRAQACHRLDVYSLVPIGIPIGCGILHGGGPPVTYEPKSARRTPLRTPFGKRKGTKVSIVPEMAKTSSNVCCLL